MTVAEVLLWGGSGGVCWGGRDVCLCDNVVFVWVEVVIVMSVCVAVVVMVSVE